MTNCWLLVGANHSFTRYHEGKMTGSRNHQTHKKGTSQEKPFLTAHSLYEHSPSTWLIVVPQTSISIHITLKRLLPKTALPWKPPNKKTLVHPSVFHSSINVSRRAFLWMAIIMGIPIAITTNSPTAAVPHE